MSVALSLFMYGCSYLCVVVVPAFFMCVVMSCVIYVCLSLVRRPSIIVVVNSVSM